MWTTYSYVCTSCDALIQVTSQLDPVLDPGCICGIDTFIVRTGTDIADPVMSITPKEVVKINTNPYN